MNNHNHNSIYEYKCSICIDYKNSLNDMIKCRVCNNEICKKCFRHMEIRYEFKKIACPKCSSVYYVELRNEIIKFALYNNIGITDISSLLCTRWKSNHLL